MVCPTSINTVGDSTDASKVRRYTPTRSAEVISTCVCTSSSKTEYQPTSASSFSFWNEDQ